MASLLRCHLQSPPSCLCSHTSPLSPSSDHQVLQQMVLGSTTTTAEHGGALLECTHTHTMDSICLWMGRQLPIPRQLQLTEGGGWRESPRAKERIKKKKAAVWPGRGQQSWNCMFGFSFFYWQVVLKTTKPCLPFKHLTIYVYQLKKSRIILL